MQAQGLGGPGFPGSMVAKLVMMLGRGKRRESLETEGGQAKGELTPEGRTQGFRRARMGGTEGGSGASVQGCK